MSIVSINGEKLKRLKAFKLAEDILISDSDKMYTTDKVTGERKEAEQIEVLIEPSLIKYWITDCGLLEELGIDATIL